MADRPGPVPVDVDHLDGRPDDDLTNGDGLDRLDEVVDWDDAEPAPRPRRTARVAAGASGAVLAAFVALLVWAVAGGSGSEVGSSPLDGKPAPPLAGPTIDGASFDLASQRGNWVIVNFFATWCPPCIREHPELVDFAERNATTNRRVVQVVFGGPQEAEATKRFVAREGGDWPIVVDSGRIAVDYAVPKVPESIIVSPTGLVLGKLRGGVTADDLDAIIDQVEGRPVAPREPGGDRR